MIPTFASWSFQLDVWGYELQGDLELSAQIAEDRDYTMPLPWDQTARELESMELWQGSERQEVPERWALPWVTEHLIRTST